MEEKLEYVLKTTPCLKYYLSVARFAEKTGIGVVAYKCIESIKEFEITDRNSRRYDRNRFCCPGINMKVDDAVRSSEDE